jgi:uncharacterized membrane protein
MELAFEAGGWWPYVLVFIAAATPILEVLVVIPAGMIAGMPPVPTALVAVAGNMTTVVLVAVAGDRMLGLWRRRRPERDRQASPRSQRARALAQRWGLPGLAFLAPITTGTHVATLAALAVGSDTRRVLRWMTAGLVAWAIAVAAATAAGIDLFT